VTLAPLQAQEGERTAVVAVVTDLRMQKRQEAERPQTDRLRALGQLAAGIAHDFNNALALIVSRAEMLREDYGSLGVPLNEGLEALVRGGMDAAATVRRILDFARERPDHPLAPLSLDDVVRDVESLTSPLWRAMAQARAVSLRLTLALGAPPPVLGDPAELREALLNLIHNAVEAMPGGGTLTITTGLAGERAYVRVADTGMGMDAATQARIFEPFFTTKGAQGNGLGLSMVYGIVRRHGGEIAVHSAAGEGTVLTLAFPTAGQQAAGVAATSDDRSQPSLRVLVVDDEPLLAMMLQCMLANDGHRVTSCTDGERALERFGREPYDLVLTDLSMPEMNGWEVARAVRARRPEQPIAFLTGWGQQLDEAQLASLDVRYVLAKPFRREDLRQLVLRAASAPHAPRTGGPEAPAGEPR
jgi:CheY-like chemotaxis protein/nitrogen-specific signal transduction histidine kinase